MRKFAPIVLVLAALVGCGRGSAEVGLQFSSAVVQLGLNAPRPLADASKPTFEYFKMRFLSVYLVHDLSADQNPVGISPIVYLNPECQGDNDTGHCNLEGSGAVHEVTEYFDFTDAARVNGAINGQSNAVDPGDYKYVSLDFCVGAPTHPNVEFQLTGGVAKTATAGSCGVHSVAAEPPIHVAAGGKVTVTLAYDLQQWLVTGDGTSSNGYDAANLCDLTPSILPRPGDETGAVGSRGWCVVPAQFSPSFATE